LIYTKFRQECTNLSQNSVSSTNDEEGKPLPNIASILKEEIVRVTRKTLRAETERLRKASVQYRSEIAALKRRVADLEHQISRVGKTIAKQTDESPTAATARQVRFSAKGLRALRQRLELSAAELGTLIGVSTQTVYNWEAGTTRPRENQIAAIAALRGVGKREAAARLSESA
jgi:DNA-binding transcriptional regulator YiaG